MEVIDKDKPPQWKSIVKKIHKQKIKIKKSKSESEKSQFTEQVVDEKDENSFEEMR